MPWLVCTDGPDRGIQLELTEQVVTIGRSPDNVVRLTDEKASRFHCHLAVVDGQLELEDLNSTNGTKCLARRLRGQKVALKVGENFAIGKDVFEYRRTPDRKIAAQVETEQVVPVTPIARGRDQTRYDSASGDLTPRGPLRRWWQALKSWR
jgi:pSer/pThr/pTyr-binding forkhead associated (FHA) protein